MPPVNVLIEVPDYWQKRLDANEVIRQGSIIRDRVTKSILAHLNEAHGEVPAEATNRLFAAAKANPVAAGAVGVVAVGAVSALAVRGARVAWEAWRSSTSATIERFEAAMRSYLDEANQARITSGLIDELDAAWSATKELPNGLSRRLHASPVVGQAKQAIADFTLDFAKANKADVSELLAVDAADRDLSDYLRVQRRILDAA